MFTGNKLEDTILDVGDRVSILERATAAGGAGGGGAGEAVHLSIKNVSGGTLTKGSAVYATGSVGASGAVEVQASSNTSAATMPALGLLETDLQNNAIGKATITGVIREVDTSSWSINDQLWVNGAGALQNTRPTSGFIQKIGRVVRVHASTGEILVLGAGRTNDVPLPLYIDHANQRVGINTSLPGYDLTVSSLSGSAGLQIMAPSGGYSQIWLGDGGTNQWHIEASPGGGEFKIVETGVGYPLTILPGNKVGIGTTTPSQALDVNGVANINGDVRFNNKALVASYVSSTNIDHIWHEEATNTWHFCSDTTYQAQGNSALHSADIYLRDSSPTAHFRDTDGLCAMFHVNSNIAYILRSNSNDTNTWSSYNGVWPMQFDLNNNNASLGGDLYFRSRNNNRPLIQRVGGIFFTWDSDSYGTNYEHSIRSTNGDTWTDAITINSFGNIRMNIDSNNNSTANTLTIGHNTTGTGNTLFTLTDEGNITLSGYLHCATNNADPGVRLGDDAWIGDTDAAQTMAVWGVTSTTQGKIQFGRYSGPSIGAQDSTYFRMYSQVVASGLATTTGNNTIRYNSSSVLLKYTSLREKKKDITPIFGVLDYLNEQSPLYNLQPVMFHEKDQELDGLVFNSGRGEWVLGFIAEEVHEVAPELTNMDEDGKLSSVSVESMVPLLVAEIQRLGGLVDELYRDAHPDWNPPTVRPAERSQAELDVFNAAALKIAAETEAERQRLLEEEAEALAFRQQQQHGRLALLDIAEEEDAKAIVQAEEELKAAEEAAKSPELNPEGVL